MSQTPPEDRSLSARIVEAFLTGHLTPLLVLLSLVAGAFALQTTPREEEPQIVVPLADVLVDVPGASAAEVESMVSSRLERLLYQIDGVEYVYSTSMPHRAVVTVRFFVGEDREDSLLKLYNKLEMNADAIPPQVASWVVRPIEVDDVPICNVTLWSPTLGDHELRRLAEELEHVAQGVPDTGRTEIVGGPPRQLSVRFDPDALAARDLPIERVASALRAAATSLPVGSFERGDRTVRVEVQAGGHAADDLDELVVGVFRGRPVRLRDVASVTDGPAERAGYVRLGFGPAAEDVPDALADPTADYAAVTLAVAKRKGANAVHVSEEVQQRIAAVAEDLLPDDAHWRVTRDHGRTADDKVDELLEGLWVAVIIVIALIALTLGIREGLVVATAVPITFALTLFVNELAGYSINRVTLFALTLALGLVVDDPIVDVENIYRHLRQGKRRPLQAVLAAVNEVRPPIILATLAVMVSFIPLFFITGMMGPYMAPMALNVPLAMLMSLLVAFAVTPWLSYYVLRNHVKPDPDAVDLEDDHEAVRRSGIYRAYAWLMRPVLGHGWLRWTLLLVTGLLFAASGWIAMTRRVPLKMLPFDNKLELQVVVDLPEGTTLERTDAVLGEMARVVRGAQEVTDVTTYAGESSPIDFNGMVRHYQLRQLPHQGDLRINLVHKREREAGSHEMALRVRSWLEPVAAQHGARLQVVELPPGPPVIATVTVEVRGEPGVGYDEVCAAAQRLEARLAAEAGVVDVDTTVEDPWPRLRFELDRTKASLHGVAEAEVARTLGAAIGGLDAATFHDPRERSPLVAEIRLPRPMRGDRTTLERLAVASSIDEGTVPLGEIGTFVEDEGDQSIWHKDLERVAYVFAEVAGRAPAEVILDIQADQLEDGAEAPAPTRIVPIEERTFFASGAGIPWSMPEGIELSWTGEGEWKITLDAFRDLGLAFLAACFGIYILLVHETKSYFLPLVLMLSIPFTIIGIIPGFWLLNLAAGGEVAGAATPVFFTATAMIGMIALSGIAVRNAILLIEFLRKALDDGLPLGEAILQAGAIRLRPIFLTAGTAMLAAIPITLDPIFSGLAWALIFGLLVSSLFTLILVPMVYAMIYGRRHAS
ncbi:MAG: efflux RND transporter permease subunit [Planctomycetota bacterium]|nr:efflux RND transporter permease subunit [Planctomycetota bacterium]MDA0933620.1 efflux RND transporter permease subunit [Planctomycetota bacterium]